MKKPILCFLLILICATVCSAQVNFDKGYYIDNENNRIEGLIKNYDKRNNPSKIIFKNSDKGSVQELTIAIVSEFGVNNTSKFIRRTVNIDQSSQNTNTLGKNREPNFENKTIFLKTLIDGQSSLYSFINENRELFFFTTADGTIEQLVYKRYLLDRNKLRENTAYREQLLENLQCKLFSYTQMQQVNYTKDDLTKVFTKHNECVNQEYSNFTERNEKTNFNLSLRPRLNYSSATTPVRTFESVNLTMEEKQGFGFGIETEVVLPINKNKWSIIAEFAYQNYEAENSFENDNISGGILNSKIIYSSIEVPFGFRYYMFLSKDSKLFINTTYIFDFTLKNEFEFTRADETVLRSGEFTTLGSFSGGFGYKYLDKFSLELRLLTVSKRAINFSDSEFNSFSVIFGYTLF